VSFVLKEIQNLSKGLLMSQKDTTDDSDVLVNVWVSNATLDESKDHLQVALGTLKPDADAPVLGEQFRVFKYCEFLTNIILKYLINENETDVVKAIKQSLPHEYNLLKEIADEIKTAIDDISFDVMYDCVEVDILNDAVVAKIRYLL
jgi:hypothetical protein